MSLHPFRDIYSIDLRSLALFRIALSLLLIVDLWSRSTSLEAHYSDMGVLPRDVLMYVDSPWRISVHLFNGTWVFQALLFVIAALVAVALMIGYRSRLMTVLSWFLLLSLHNRNPLLLQASDNLLLMLLFWSMFLPLGARYSMDMALAGVAKDHERGGERGGHALLTVASVAILLQVMLVYFFGALHQYGTEWIPDGTALYFAFHVDIFATPLAIWLRHFPGLLQVLTYMVWVLELVGPILVFIPVFTYYLRFVVISGLCALQLGLLLCMDLGLHPWVGMTALLLFIPAGFWRRAAQWFLAVEDFTVLYRDDLAGRRLAGLVQTVFFLQGEAEPREHLKTVIACVDKRGRMYSGKHALSRMVFRAWPLVPFNFVWRLPGVYPFLIKWVGSRSITVSVSDQVRPGMWQQAVAGLCFVYIFAFNVSTLPQSGLRLPAFFRPFHDALRLDQRWAIFAPYPMKDDGWHIIKGQLIDGSVVDVLAGRFDPPKWVKPTSVAAIYPDSRWRQYLIRLRYQAFYAQRVFYGRYVCHHWNRNRVVDRQLQMFEMYYHYEMTGLPGQPMQTDVKLLWRHDCFARPKAG